MRGIKTLAGAVGALGLATSLVVLPGASANAATRQFGTAGDVPVPGYYLAGAAKAEFAVWRPKNGTWYVLNNATGLTTTRQWGVSGDKPVPADYDGDGRTDYAVWRPSNGPGTSRAAAPASSGSNNGV